MYLRHCYMQRKCYRFFVFRQLETFCKFIPLNIIISVPVLLSKSVTEIQCAQTHATYIFILSTQEVLSRMN